MFMLIGTNYAKEGVKKWTINVSDYDKSLHRQGVSGCYCRVSAAVSRRCTCLIFRLLLLLLLLLL